MAWSLETAAAFDVGVMRPLIFEWRRLSGSISASIIESEIESGRGKHSTAAAALPTRRADKYF
jgi:hypothetical protein